MFSNIFPAAAAFLYTNLPLIAGALILLVLLNALRLRARHVRRMVQQAKHTQPAKTRINTWDMYGTEL